MHRRQPTLKTVNNKLALLHTQIPQQQSGTLPSSSAIVMVAVAALTVIKDELDNSVAVKEWAPSKELSLTMNTNAQLVLPATLEAGKVTATEREPPSGIKSSVRSVKKKQTHSHNIHSSIIIIHISVYTAQK